MVQTSTGGSGRFPAGAGYPRDHEYVLDPHPLIQPAPTDVATARTVLRVVHWREPSRAAVLALASFIAERRIAEALLGG